MAEFMKVLLSLSLSGTLLLLLIFLPGKLYKTKLSRTWQYYIWLAAALRFVLPFTLNNTIVGGLFAAGDRAEYARLLAIVPGGRVETGTGNPAAAVTGDSISISTCLFSLWLACALFFLLRKIAAYRKFMRHIRLCNMEVTDGELLKKLADCKERLHIKREVKLYRNTGIVSPVMTGFIRPCIVLPVSQVNEERLYYIFNHELTHYKRRDMFYKWLIQLVICIHWFNPFVYLLRKEINRACELACDEAVVSSLDEKGKRAYGDTLLSFLRTDSSRKNDFVAVTLAEGAEQVKERLGAIVDYHRKSTGIKAVTAALTAAVCIGFAAVGAYAAEDNEMDKTVPGQVAPGQVMSNGTVSDQAVWGKTALDENPLDKVSLEVNMVNATAPGDISLDVNLLHWHGSLQDVTGEVLEAASGYIVIKYTNEDGSACYSGWGIGKEEDVYLLDMSERALEQVIQPLACNELAVEAKAKMLIESHKTVNEEGKSVGHSTYVFIPEDAEILLYEPDIKE